MSATMILIVGGAVLAPSLLFPDSAVPVPLPGVAGDLITPPTPGHVLAVARLMEPILGVESRLEGTDATFALRRFTEVMNGLIPFKGAIPGSPGFAQLTSADLLVLCDHFIAAVRLGVEEDAYELGEAGQAFGGTKSQSELFDDINEQKITGLLRALGGALLAVVTERTKAANLLRNGIATFGTTSRPAVKALVDLATEMDSQGRPNPLGAVPGVGDLFESIGTATENVPSKITDAVSSVGNKLGGLVGDTLGGILFSTPVLLLVGGYVLYRVANK